MSYIIASPNEIRQLQEAEARISRIQRLKQVREQERLLAVGRRSIYKSTAKEAWADVADALHDSWSTKKAAELKELQATKGNVMLQFGMAHRDASSVTTQRVKLRADMVEKTEKRLLEESERATSALALVQLEHQKGMEPLCQKEQLRASINAQEHVDLTAHERSHPRPIHPRSRSVFDETMFHRDYVVTKIDAPKHGNQNAKDAAQTAAAATMEKLETRAKRRVQYEAHAKQRFSTAIHDVNMDKQRKDMYGLLEELRRDYVRERQSHPLTAVVDSKSRLKTIETTFEKSFGIVNT
ncbi:hypothetical protein SeMB42_g02774 [Synchytrium endobioticum]|uniref:Uncharacterized protein n=1 Tax=Synchytrium endobioticum TaxID=286115 RepID=A0A507DDR6_9FUNG|nr:hypothetical protein SeMB42_g02774 [Synchytrium endobioticum]